jgi:hypothetical protein
MTTTENTILLQLEEASWLLELFLVESREATEKIKKTIEQVNTLLQANIIHLL